MKFAFFTLGCKVNLFETQALQQLARARGHEVVEHDADAVVVNTCTVTAVSDHKNIRAFHKLRKENPRAVIAACGCFAQVDPERLQKAQEIDLICGTRDRAAVIAQCENAVSALPAEKEHGGETQNGFEFLPAGIPAGHTRALLKIEDGCDNFCSYCIIPYARGRVRSLPPDRAEEEARRLAGEGANEIVLTGIEIASYGRDLTPRVTLADLLVRLLSACPQTRFRLGSLDPRVIGREFCEKLSGFQNLARHFHLSLQSGCDSVLLRMGRRYTTEEYAENVELLKRYFPDCSVTTDLIVGFPGETEEEFSQTLAFLKRCGFASVHVFPFSAREKTRAFQMEGQLPKETKAERAARAKAVAAELSAGYRFAFVKRHLEVLPEHCANGWWTAHGPYCFPVYIREGEGIAKNRPVSVITKALFRDGLSAAIADGEDGQKPIPAKSAPAAGTADL